MAGEKEIQQLNQHLSAAARIPYNTATIAYHLAGEIPDARFGGSCLDKLSVFTSNAIEVTEASTITVQEKITNNITHFAAIIVFAGMQLYADPFLWQAELLILEQPGSQRTAFAPTIFSNFHLQMDGNTRTADSFKVDLVAHRPERKTLISHSYQLQAVTAYPFVKSVASLPSFCIQFPSYDSTLLYKVWYNKKRRDFNDIWSTDQFGVRTKSSALNPDIKQRMQIYNDIELALDVTIQELRQFFVQAYALQLAGAVSDEGGDSSIAEHE